MARVVPSTFHQMIKHVWKNEEPVTHGEWSHSRRHALIIEAISRGIDFYTVELVNVTSEDLAP